MEWSHSKHLIHSSVSSALIPTVLLSLSSKIESNTKGVFGWATKRFPSHVDIRRYRFLHENHTDTHSKHILTLCSTSLDKFQLTDLSVV
jgi:hypothetical protein